jgi:tetratricopeptide (TPR) repeat protein
LSTADSWCCVGSSPASLSIDLRLATYAPGIRDHCSSGLKQWAADHPPWSGTAKVLAPCTSTCRPNPALVFLRRARFSLSSNTLRLTNLHVSISDPEKAAEQRRREEKLREIRLFRDKGLAYLHDGRYEDAAGHFHSAFETARALDPTLEMELDPKPSSSSSPLPRSSQQQQAARAHQLLYYLILAQMASQTPRLDETVIAETKKRAADRPNDEFANAALADVLEMLGCWDEAERALLVALDGRRGAGSGFYLHRRLAELRRRARRSRGPGARAAQSKSATSLTLTAHASGGLSPPLRPGSFRQSSWEGAAPSYYTG